MITENKVEMHITYYKDPGVFLLATYLRHMTQMLHLSYGELEALIKEAERARNAYHESQRNAVEEQKECQQ